MEKTSPFPADLSDSTAQGTPALSNASVKSNLIRSSMREDKEPNHDDVEIPPGDTHPVDSDGDGDKRQIHGLKWALVCISLYISAFLYGLDTTIAADVQGPIIEAFGHIEQLAWVGTGFPLGSVAVILLNGAIYTTFNMKWMYVASVLLFEIGSVICGAAPSMTAMIVGRVIAGAGGSGLYLGCLSSPLERNEEPILP
jgi:hypothetical protein